MRILAAFIGMSVIGVVAGVLALMSVLAQMLPLLAIVAALLIIRRGRRARSMRRGVNVQPVAARAPLPRSPHPVTGSVPASGHGRWAVVPVPVWVPHSPPITLPRNDGGPQIIEGSWT